jgi:hypothetical protein
VAVVVVVVVVVVVIVVLEAPPTLTPHLRPPQVLTRQTSQETGSTADQTGAVTADAAVVAAVNPSHGGDDSEEQSELATSTLQAELGTATGSKSAGSVQSAASGSRNSAKTERRSHPFTTKRRDSQVRDQELVWSKNTQGWPLTPLQSVPHLPITPNS